MKRILSFFAAVAVAGLTQAVTINWDSVKGAVDLGTKTSSGSIAVGTSEGQANLGSGSWTIAAKLAAGSISAYTNAGHKYPAIIGFGTSETKKTPTASGPTAARAAARTPAPSVSKTISPARRPPMWL